MDDKEKMDEAGKKATGCSVYTRVRAREVRLIELENRTSTCRELWRLRGGWPQVCVYGIHIFTRLLVSRSWRTCGSRDDAGLSYGRFVPVRFSDAWRVPRWPVGHFSLRLGVGKGYTRRYWFYLLPCSSPWLTVALGLTRSRRNVMRGPCYRVLLRPFHGLRR